MNKSFENSSNSGSEKGFTAAPAKYGAKWLEPSPSSLAKVSPDRLKPFLDRGNSTDGIPTYRQPNISSIYPKPWSKSLYRPRHINKDIHGNDASTIGSADTLKSPSTYNRKGMSPSPAQEFDHLSQSVPKRFVSVPERKVSASRQLFDRDFNSQSRTTTTWRENKPKDDTFKLPKPKPKPSVRNKEVAKQYPSNTLDIGHTGTFLHSRNNFRPGSENSFFITSSKHESKKNESNMTSPNFKIPSSTIPGNVSKVTLSSVASDESGIIMKSIKTNKLTEDKCAALKCWSSEKETTRHFFAHYDWQSMTFTFDDAKLAIETLKRKNETTGASKAAAAKLQSAENSPATSLENLSFLGTEGENEKSSNDMILWCPYFLNELGGDNDENSIEISESGKAVSVQWVRPDNNYSVTNSPTQAQMILSNHKGLSVMEKSGIEDGKMLNTNGFVMEHIDRGALYYKTHFVNQEHQNFFGIDDCYGPIAVSLKRERVKEVNSNNTKENIWQYRIIVRTSETCTLRGSILEDVLLSQNHPAGRGLRPRDVLEYACPEIDINCLKIAQATDVVQKQLIKVDEQNVSSTYKFGILYCKKGQSTEEDMYNNVTGSPAFEEFLDLLGDKIQLKGFNKFRGGLDVKTNSTGTESYFTTFQGNEIMFHVSTLLPHSKNNRQQLLRKRHVGNDIVTIIFQEPDSKPFSPEHIRSHFQHIFLIVRAHQPCSAHTSYRIAQSRYHDIPFSSPIIPKNAVFPKSETFREFLLTKIINSENAARNAGKFKAMSMNTRQEYLRDLAMNHCTINPVDTSGTKFTKFSLPVPSRRRDKGKGKISPEINCTGAVVWHVTLKDCGPNEISCLLGISDYVLALIHKLNKRVVFSIPCQAIIGWSEYSSNVLHIYYGRGERLSISASSCAACSWKKEVISRLQEFTIGDTAITQNLRRNSKRQLGFHINYEGIVMDVEQKGVGWQQGKLIRGCRLVEICKILVVTMSHDEMLDLLRTSDVVNVIMIPPHEDGTPRRCSKSLYHISPVVKVCELKNLMKTLENDVSNIRLRSSSANKVKRSYVMSSEDINMNSEQSSMLSNRNSSQYGSSHFQSDNEHVSTARKQINFDEPTRPMQIQRGIRRQYSHDVIDNTNKVMSYSLNTNKSNNESNSFTVPQKRNKDKARIGNIKHSTSTESGLNVVGVSGNNHRKFYREISQKSQKISANKSQYINYKLQNFVIEKHMKSNGSVTHRVDNSKNQRNSDKTSQPRRFNRTRKKLTRTMSDESICGIVPQKSKQRNSKHQRHVTSDEVPIADQLDNWDQLVNIASKIDDPITTATITIGPSRNSIHETQNGHPPESECYSENDISNKSVHTTSTRSISPAEVLPLQNLSAPEDNFDPISSLSNRESTEAEERLRQIEHTLKAIQSQLSEEKRSKQMILKEVEKLRMENSRLQNQALLNNSKKGPTYF